MPKSLDRADISWCIGLPVSGILYWVLSRSIDLEGETRTAKAAAEQLERAAHEHRTA